MKLLISHSWYSLVDDEDQSSGLFVVLNVSSWSVGSTIPSAAAVGLTAVVPIIIPGRSAIVLPLLLMSPLLLVLLRGPGLFLLDVLLVSLRAAFTGCRFAADVNHERTVGVGVLRAIHEHFIVHVLVALCG